MSRLVSGIGLAGDWHRRWFELALLDFIVLVAGRVRNLWLLHRHVSQLRVERGAVAGRDGGRERVGGTQLLQPLRKSLLVF